MNTITTTAQPTTVEEVKATNKYIFAKTLAMAYSEVSKQLPEADGPITSKKLFVDIPAGAKLVYEFYRLRNKDQKIYVIL